MSNSRLVPALFTVIKGYSKEQFFKDFISGIIVAIIALPLSIALALASGVGPEEGIYTAIVAGFLISLFGGSRVQIAGPTAAFATIVAGIVAKDGMSGLMLATIFAGALLILMGLLKLGRLIKFIPYTITTGFTAGIAVTIIIGQIKDFLGLSYPKGTVTIETTDKIKAMVENIHSFNAMALLVGLVCLVVLALWPKIPKIGDKIPASLIAVFVGIGMVKGGHLNVNTIGDLYTISNHLPTLHLPDAITFHSLQNVATNGVTIAVLAAIESLLSCVVADSMINANHRSNMELVAQGIGNIGSALFGGIPATGAIARTAANIKNGGRTPIAGIVHSITLVLILVILMPYAALIPMPTIAAILFQVGYNMCGHRTFLHILKTAPKSDIFVLVTTFALTVVFDLVVAIAAGMVLSCILLMKRLADEASIEGWINYDDATDDDDIELKKVPDHVRVYEISGPMFFGMTDLITQVKAEENTRVFIIRMRAVPALDASAMHSLEDLYRRCQKKKIGLVFSHVNEQPLRTMTKAGFVEKIGSDNFCKHIDDALTRASQF
ncbi:sulfate permease, SulP family [Lachnospiraceae bacterium KHCPX20]|nr:sulfate permease, SulP family [Lachnospiraceae bacterium KHCPX20]